MGYGACAHQSQQSPPAVTEKAVPPPNDPAPGATPAERNRLMDATWKEVIIKAGKEENEVVAAIKLVEPRIRLFHAAPEVSTADDEAKAVAKKAANAADPEVIDLATELRKITPLDVDHIDILDGQVSFIDTSRKERPEMWLHDLQLSVENLATRVHLTEGRPALFTASGVLARSGILSIFLTADPFEKGLNFSGRAALVGMKTADLYKFIEPVSDLQAPQGTVDIFIEFECRNGELTGGIKPILKNVEIRPDSKKVLTVLKAWVTDFAIDLISDRVKDRNAVATVIPIKGKLSGPDVQLWPAIFGVMRNAFVEGLTAGYAYLPPPTSKEKQGVIEQGIDALTGSDPPKAQPTESDKSDRATPSSAPTAPTKRTPSSPPRAP